jgi:hypothetical protein
MLWAPHGGGKFGLRIGKSQSAAGPQGRSGWSFQDSPINRIRQESRKDNDIRRCPRPGD